MRFYLMLVVFSAIFLSLADSYVRLTNQRTKDQMSIDRPACGRSGCLAYRVMR